MPFPDERKQMPWPVVMIAGYILPGAGHFLHGERVRGILVGFTVLATFALGLLLGGVRVVELPDFSLPGTLLGQLFSQVAFIPQFFAGPVTLVSGYISKTLASNPESAGLISHGRIYDIGVIYTGVAGGLNLMALIDVTARSAAGLPPRDTAESRAELARQREKAAISQVALNPQKPGEGGSL